MSAHDAAIWPFISNADNIAAKRPFKVISHACTLDNLQYYVGYILWRERYAMAKWGASWRGYRERRIKDKDASKPVMQQQFNQFLTSLNSTVHYIALLFTLVALKSAKNRLNRNLFLNCHSRSRHQKQRTPHILPI